VAHACNPSYSGVRDQGIAVGSQPGQTVHETYLEKPFTKKRAGGVTQGVGPEFKPQYHKKKKKVLNVRSETLKLLREKKRENLEDKGL
jgi:hypothetical protein